MEILFLGTGDAFSSRANTSILVDGKILLDCGLTTVQQLMKSGADLNEISVISISHYHMDHVFGLPAFLSACKKEGRTKPLNVYGPAGAERYLNELLRVAHKKSLDVFGYEIRAHDAENNVVDGCRLSFAPMKHALPCNAVAIEKDGLEITYTGDGKPTDEAKKIMASSDLLIAESYMTGDEHHHSLNDSAKLALETKSKRLAAVHISRKEDVRKEMDEALKIFKPILLPEDLTIVRI